MGHVAPLRQQRETAMPIDQQPPDVLAMVLADVVPRDTVSGKNYIKGTYSVISANEFPVRYPSIVVYVAITNGHGKTELEMRLGPVDKDREPVFVSKMVVDFPDPLAVIEAIFGHVQAVFPEPG